MGLTNEILRAMNEVALLQHEFQREQVHDGLFQNEVRRMKETGSRLFHCAQSLEEELRLGPVSPYRVADFHREVKLVEDNIRFLRSLLEINRQHQVRACETNNAFLFSSSECQSVSGDSSCSSSSTWTQPNTPRHLNASIENHGKSVRFAPEVQHIHFYPSPCNSRPGPLDISRRAIP